MSEDTNAAEHPTDSSASLRDAPEPQPAHDTALPAAPRRQSLVLRSGVCDMRVGADALDRLGQDLHQTAGTSRSALLVAADDVDRELQERVRPVAPRARSRLQAGSMRASVMLESTPMTQSWLSAMPMSFRWLCSCPQRGVGAVP